MNLELFSVAAAGLVRAHQRGLEDVVITLGTQYHVVRLMPSQTRVFLYVVLDRKRAIVGMARQRLAALVRRIKV